MIGGGSKTSEPLTELNQFLCGNGTTFGSVDFFDAVCPSV